jgi:hypothetical protein
MAVEEIEQTELAFPAAVTPASDAVDIERLTRCLAGREGWSTAREIAAETGLSDRKIRELASRHGDEILSGPGSPGYKLLSAATLEEIRHTAARMGSQAAAMRERQVRLLREAHRRVG